MPDLDVTGYRLLAVAVLRQAVEDVADARLPAAHRERARAFLKGAGTLDVWAGLVGLSPDGIHGRSPRAPSSRQMDS